MSDPIQSISQSNYILHNIDAKKLYVQEPLFTANSGDAVYVGWRPDETVLWSGSLETIGSSATLSEPLTSFETIKFYYRDHNGNINGISELPTNYWPDFPGINETFVNNQGLMGYRTLRFITNSNKDVISVNGAAQFNISTNSVSNYSHVSANNADCLIFIKEIRGCNRKENA